MLPRSIIAIAVVAAFVSQGWSAQNTSLVTLMPSSPSSSSQASLCTSSQTISPTAVSVSAVSNNSTPAGRSVSVTICPPPSSSVYVESPTTMHMAPTTAPLPKTCASISFVLNVSWSDSYADSSSKVHQNVKSVIPSQMDLLYNDTSKYIHLQVSVLSLKEKERKVMVSFRLCMVVKKADGGFIEDVFMKANTLFISLRVIEDTVEFKAYGVKFTNWEAKDGECTKCSRGGGGPVEIKAGKCEPEDGYSCTGLKTATNKSNHCVEYCDSSVAVATISSFALTLGILVSVSFNMWK